MDDEMTLPPPPPAAEYCYRHPNVETGVHCTRCGRPICPDCMIPAPVGHQCPECVAEARREFRQGPGRRIAAANIRRSASVTTALLVAIGAMFLVELANGGPGSLMTGPANGKLVDLGASLGLGQRADGSFIGIATGQYWRLVSSMFLHAGVLHIAFNAYALWIFGTVVEQELGRIRLLLIYFATGIVASAASYAFSPSPVIVSVGASGAIFGLFGILLSAGRLHHPVDRQSRALVGQVGFLIVINLVFGFASGGTIDNFAHIGGLVAGLWLGAVIVPTGVPTLSSFWQRPGGAPGPSQRAANAPVIELIGVVVVMAAVATGIVIGTAERTGRVGAIDPYGGPSLGLVKAADVQADPVHLIRQAVPAVARR
jgi:membrane associated rhomboid family serine protease